MSKHEGDYFKIPRLSGYKTVTVNILVFVGVLLSAIWPGLINLDQETATQLANQFFIIVAAGTALANIVLRAMTKTPIFKSPSQVQENSGSSDDTWHGGGGPGSQNESCLGGGGYVGVSEVDVRDIEGKPLSAERLSRISHNSDSHQQPSRIHRHDHNQITEVIDVDVENAGVSESALYDDRKLKERLSSILGGCTNFLAISHPVTLSDPIQPISTPAIVHARVTGERSSHKLLPEQFYRKTEYRDDTLLAHAADLIRDVWGGIKEWVRDRKISIRNRVDAVYAHMLRFEDLIKLYCIRTIVICWFGIALVGCSALQDTKFFAAETTEQVAFELYGRYIILQRQAVPLLKDKRIPVTVKRRIQQADKFAKPIADTTYKLVLRVSDTRKKLAVQETTQAKLSVLLEELSYNSGILKTRVANFQSAIEKVK